jgi:hypothetical protein
MKFNAATPEDRDKFLEQVKARIGKLGVSVGAEPLEATRVALYGMPQDIQRVIEFKAEAPPPDPDIVAAQAEIAALAKLAGKRKKKPARKAARKPSRAARPRAKAAPPARARKAATARPKARAKVLRARPATRR